MEASELEVVEESTEWKNRTSMDITNNIAADIEGFDKILGLSEKVTNPDGSRLSLLIVG